MLRAHHITIHSGIDRVLDGVDIELGATECVGLVGPNGSGKSTLLRILAGVQRPDRGTVVSTPGCRVGWLAPTLPEGPTTVADLLAVAARSVTEAYAVLLQSQEHLAASPAPELDRRLVELAEAEDAFAAVGGWPALARHDEVRSRLGIGTADGIEPDRPLSDLSGGEQARVLLAGLLLADPDVLLLDEPTNHLDLAGRRWLAAYLAAFTGAVLVASHDRAFLDATVTRIVELDDLTATLEDYPGGGWTAYRQERERRRERRALDLEAQEKYRRRLAEQIAASKAGSVHHEAANPRNPGARRTAKMVARKAIVRERRLTRLIESSEWVQPLRHRDPLTFPRVEPGSPPRTVVVDGLQVVAGPRELYAVDLAFSTHDRIWLTGANGIGKSSLLAAVHERLPDAVLLRQEHELGHDDRSALDGFRASRPGYVDEAERLLAAYGLDAATWTRPLRRLSAGQRQRMALAAALSTPASMLLLDEPTNHLDTDSIEALEQVLSRHRGGLIVVTHDERFAAACGLRREWNLGDAARPAGVA